MSAMWRVRGQPAHKKDTSQQGYGEGQERLSRWNVVEGQSVSHIGMPRGTAP